MKLNNYMQTLTERDYKKILICLTLYLTSLFAANTLGMKLMPFIFGTNLSVGYFYFILLFQLPCLGRRKVFGLKIATTKFLVYQHVYPLLRLRLSLLLNIKTS